MNLQKIAIIGGGISGLSIAHCLKDKYTVKVYEKESRPGGLIKCDVVEGNVYHMVGGHVFNSRRQDVLDWFWQHFNQSEEFFKAVRNASVYLNKPIGYPIENHLYQLDAETIKLVVADLLQITKSGTPEPSNFEEFLRYRFGETLYRIYFKPYNEKIWKQDLSKVSLKWLEGKLPMPSVNDIFFNNINKEKETTMVHSSFFYPKKNGSQFLADKLALGLSIEYNTEVNNFRWIESKKKWSVNESEEFDSIIFAGNVKELPSKLTNINLGSLDNRIQNLDYHGTTTVLCEIDENPYSWIYLPDTSFSGHRIICTGNFSENNSRHGIKTATVEFTDFIGKEDILDNLKRIPYHPKYITHKFTEYTYPIQTEDTRTLINEVKAELKDKNMYLLGRFAEWEYYNMDAAVGAAIDLAKSL